MQEMGRMATALPITAPRVERHRGALTGGQTALAPARAAHGEVASTLHPAADTDQNEPVSSHSASGGASRGRVVTEPTVDP